MTIGSLCSGYGGLDMGVQQVLDAEVAWHCEYAAAPSKILAHHWPDVPNHRDLTTTDWAAVEPVDIITAGWPCQPWSLAGKGKGADDERAIWPAIADAVRALRPSYVFLENVASIVTKGELARVAADLDGLGYVGAWHCMRASDVGAPHGRKRCFIVATDTGGEALGLGAGLRTSGTGGLRRRRPDDGRLPMVVAERTEAPTDWGKFEPAIRRWESVIGRPAPCPTDAGLTGARRLNPRFAEWMMGLEDGHVTDVDGLTRNDQLKALGNGVVPQQAAAAYQALLSDALAVAA